MAKTLSSPILQTIRGLVEDQRVNELGDDELLRRFIARRDEDAFHALLRRHGPVVLGVCRSLLPAQADAEDAFQATFLVFARKARGIRQATSLGSWLHGVAYRIALKARAGIAKRKKHEGLAPARAVVESADDLTWRDVQAVVHRELNALPDRYRAVLVPCYLEGKTQDEVAHHLKLPKGTLKGRLERGRALLRKRLVRRGLGPVAVLVASGWPAPESAAVPPALTAATGRVVAGVVSARVLTLAGGLGNAVLLTRLKVATVLLLALSIGGAGAGSFLRATPTDQKQPERPAGGPGPDQSKAAAPQRPPAPEADRAAAEWVIDVGGRIRTAAGYFSKGDPLGDGPFHITAIALGANDKVKDDDLARFKGLSKLNNLSLARTPVGDASLKHIAGLASLESLYLPSTKVGDAGLAHLKGMTGLVNLYLDGTMVTDAGLAHLPAMTGLRVLYLRQTPITDAGLKHLKAMPRLAWVDLGGTRVTDAGVKDLQAALPRCTIKNVAPKDDRPPPIADPPAGAQAAAVAAVKKLGGKIESDDQKKMKAVDLSRSKVTDADLAHLKGLPDVEYLDLYDTAVGDAGLEHLKGLTKLKFLMLKRTDVTAAGVQKLRRALPGCEIIHSPRNPWPAEIGTLAGRWRVEFANGVKQVCEVRGADGTASVVEPGRTSGGKVAVHDGVMVIVYDDERVERWTRVGERLVVEHWAPSPGFHPGAKWGGYAPLRPLPITTPVLGIADRAP